MYIFSVALRPNVGHGLLIREVFGPYSTAHHNRYDTSGQVISSSQRPLPENAQHSKQTNIHAPFEIRTHSLSTRTAADPRLSTRGHWNRPNNGTCIPEITDELDTT
jgi:hypothetical protein